MKVTRSQEHSSVVFSKVSYYTSRNYCNQAQYPKLVQL